MSVQNYQPVIGLEVHAQLLTKAKLFSSAGTAFGDAPNSHVTEVCLAFPGSLPVPNSKAIELAVRAGVALSCRISEVSEWSRKHYFYPDLPKGYQITQYERPLCVGGEVIFDGPNGEQRGRLARIHVEEDAGKLVHDAAPGRSLVDLNRAGTPLIEIVGEPDLRSADEAVEYLKALREVLVAIGVNDGNLDEGSFRCDANVSVMKSGSSVFGTRCELKNLNSFRFIKQAIEYEVARQVELLESGQAVAQETRLFDEKRGETRAMRSKEEARDYRYFPEPDLPLLRVASEEVASAKRLLPELPRARRTRWVQTHGLSPVDALALTQSPTTTDLFEACVSLGAPPKKVANWVMGEVSRLMNETGRVGRFMPAQLVALIEAVESGTVSGAAGKEVLAQMHEYAVEPTSYIAEHGLAQSSDATEVERLADEVIAANLKNVEAYRAGNTKLLGFFVGQVLKRLGGKGNPKLVNEVLLKKLSAR